eukprot:Sro41_g025360.2  (735) ;mRNA; f:144524-146728
MIESLSNEGLVANRKRQIAGRLSTAAAAAGGGTYDNRGNAVWSSSPKKSLSACKSFPPERKGSPEDSDASLGTVESGQNRVATLREQFDHSHSGHTLDTTNSSRHSLESDASSSSTAEVSDDDGDDDDCSVGSLSFSQDDDDEDEDFTEDVTSTVNTPADMTEKKEKEIQELLHEASFNTTFLKVQGSSGKDYRQTGRGCLFVVADDRLGKTKVIQSKLNKAAKKIQRFFRYSMAILVLHGDELQYWRQCIDDCERRRQEELIQLQHMVEIQKHQFQVELERETSHKLEKDLEETQDVLTQHQREWTLEKEEHETLRADISKITHENLLLKAQVNDPVQADKKKDLEEKIQVVEFQKQRFGEAFDQLKGLCLELKDKIRVSNEKASTEQYQKSALRQCIYRIIQRLANSEEVNHADSELANLILQLWPQAETDFLKARSHRKESHHDEPVATTEPTKSEHQELTISSNGGDLNSSSLEIPAVVATSKKCSTRSSNADGQPAEPVSSRTVMKDSSLRDSARSSKRKGSSKSSMRKSGSSPLQSLIECTTGGTRKSGEPKRSSGKELKSGSSPLLSLIESNKNEGTSTSTSKSSMRKSGSSPLLSLIECTTGGTRKSGEPKRRSGKELKSGSSPLLSLIETTGSTRSPSKSSMNKSESSPLLSLIESTTGGTTSISGTPKRSSGKEVKDKDKKKKKSRSKDNEKSDKGGKSSSKKSSSKGKSKDKKSKRSSSESSP